MSTERWNAALRWVLVAIAAVLVAPLAPAVILALWFAGFAKSLHRPLARAIGVRRAAAVSVLSATVVAFPFALMVGSLAVDAYHLVAGLLDSQRGKEVLERLVSPDRPARPGTSSLWDLILSHKEGAWDLAQTVAGTAAHVVIELVVIIFGTYALLVDGDAWYAWAERHAPISPSMLARLRDAFHETGRGLFVGIGGAAFLQSVAATIAYLALDIPSPFALGLLTFCCAIVPAIGTAIVWAPVAAGLALTGRTDAAIELAAFGLLVVSTVDNLVRPWLARWGRLQLPTFVVLVAMFAGVLVIGAWGLVLAPLAVRLARAALEAE